MILQARDASIVVAERDSSACPLCGCAIFRGDVLYRWETFGVSAHRCCYEVASGERKPQFTPLNGPLFS